MTKRTRSIMGLAAALMAAAGVPQARTEQAPSREEVARLQFENGRGHMRRGNYEEALKDFRAVAESYPDSAVADNARLEISRYYLEVADDPVEAVKQAEEILKRYPTSDSAPYAYLVQGQVVLQRSRRRDELEKAVATFDRVPGIYPDADAVPSALYLSAEALRLAQRPADAIARYRRLVAAYPTDAIIPKVHIGTAMALSATGDQVAALEEFQLARSVDAAREDADLARARATTLFRLYIRPAQAPAFAYSAKDSPSIRAKDVTGMVVTARGQGYFSTRTAVVPFMPSGAEPPPAAAKVRGVALDRLGRLVAIDAGSLKVRNAPPVPLSVVQGGVAKALDDVIAAASFKNGEWIVASDDDRAIQRFSPAGKHLGAFANVRASRLAINDFDEVAALDRDAKAIKLFDEAGKPLGAIPERGAGYELKNPVDLAFDAFGHLYVLERNGILVFRPGRPESPFVRAFFEPENSPGALRRAAAFAFDAEGRVYIADDNAEKIRVYE
jgi:outer membrane protein assembly factor BamD (BamD/ComL family)